MWKSTPTVVGPRHINYAQLFSFQVAQYVEPAKGFAAVLSKSKAAKWKRMIFEVDFTGGIIVLQEKDAILCSQPFAAFLDVDAPTDDDDTMLVLGFYNYIEWKLMIQNTADRLAIQHILEFVKRDSSAEDVVRAGVGVAGMSKEVIQCGTLIRRAKTQLKRDARWVVLVPGKLLIFKMQETVGRHVRYVSSLIGASVKPTLNGLEFQVSAPGTKVVTFEAASLEELQSWLGAFDQAILAALHELNQGHAANEAAKGIIMNAATRASVAAPAAEPRTMSDPTPPKPPPMAPVLERSVSALPARNFNRSNAFKDTSFPRPEPLTLSPESAGTPRAFPGTPTGFSASPSGTAGVPAEHFASPTGLSPGWKREGASFQMPPPPRPINLGVFAAAESQTPKSPAPFSPFSKPPLIPRPAAAFGSVGSPSHTEASARVFPTAAAVSVCPEMAALPPEVAAAISAAASAQAKATADVMVHDLASAEARAAHAEAMYKAMATAEGVASAAKAAAQAASEALAKAEAVSAATETSQKDALAAALARSARTEQNLQTMEKIVVEAKAQKEVRGKSLAEMLAAAAAVRGSAPTFVVNYNSNTQNNYAAPVAAAVEAPKPSAEPAPPVITELLEDTNPISPPESAFVPAEAPLEISAGIPSNTPSDTPSDTSAEVPSDTPSPFPAESTFPGRNVKAMYSPGWAGVLGRAAGVTETGSESAGSATGTPSNRDRFRRQAEFTDSEASDSEAELGPGGVQTRSIRVPGRRSGLSSAERSSSQSPQAEAATNHHVAPALGSPRSPANPLAARVAAAAAAATSSVIPPAEHFLRATTDGTKPGEASPGRSPQAVHKPALNERPIGSAAELEVPLTSTVTAFKKSPQAVTEYVTSAADEPQLLRPSDLRVRAGLSSQNARAEDPKVTSASFDNVAAKMTSASSVAARAEAFQKVVDASTDKAPDFKKTWSPKHVSTSEGVYSPKTQFAQAPPPKRNIADLP